MNACPQQARPLLIVGSQGRMGALLMRRFQETGTPVAGIDHLHDAPPTEETLHALCGKAAVVLLCVPAAVLRPVIARLTPYMPPDAVLADITSVKIQPLEQMEAAWPGPVVGTHPLFGPAPAPGMELPVTVVPGARATEAHTHMVEQPFVRMGCRVFRSTAEQHDEAMAAIQGLNFISSLAYFATLARREELLPFLTPSFRRRQEAARKLLTEDAPLFEGLFEANPYSHDLVRQYRAFLNIAAAGDLALLAERAAWWWKK